MRSKIILVVAATAAAGLLTTSAVALDRPQVFSLLDASTNNGQPIEGFTFERLPRAGDRFTLDDVLYKWAGKKRGAPAGHLYGLCTFLSVNAPPAFAARALCTAHLLLPAGSVVVEGTVRFTDGPARFSLPVLGGTGGYANVRGFVKIRDLGTGDSNNSNIEFHLLP